MQSIFIFTLIYVFSQDMLNHQLLVLPLPWDSNFHLHSHLLSDLSLNFSKTMGLGFDYLSKSSSVLKFIISSFYKLVCIQIRSVFSPCTGMSLPSSKEKTNPERRGLLTLACHILSAGAITLTSRVVMVAPSFFQ